jgi:hypothetical protein
VAGMTDVTTLIQELLSFTIENNNIMLIKGLQPQASIQFGQPTISIFIDPTQRKEEFQITKFTTSKTVKCFAKRKLPLQSLILRGKLLLTFFVWRIDFMILIQFYALGARFKIKMKSHSSGEAATILCFFI